MNSVNIVKTLHSAGMTSVELADLVGVSRTTFDKAKKEFEKTGKSVNERYNMIFLIICSDKELSREKIRYIVELVKDYSDKRDLIQTNLNRATELSMETLRIYIDTLNIFALMLENPNDIDNFYNGIDESENRIMRRLTYLLKDDDLEKVKNLKYEIGSVVEGVIIEITDDGFRVKLEVGTGFANEKDLPKSCKDTVFYLGQKVKGKVSLNFRGNIKLLNIECVN